MKNVDLVIIGGGPAGLAAAVAARKSGVQDILSLERDSEPVSYTHLDVYKRQDEMVFVRAVH